MVATDYSSSFNRFVFDAVPCQTKCLDVGSSTGNLGSALVGVKKCRVDGIEINDVASKVAKGRGYGNVISVDLNSLQTSLPLCVEYDIIICADVLEHLIDPVGALELLKKYLKPGGLFIISLPNVAFLLNRLSLLFGRWNYREYGILDQTHLRFYTIDSGKRMVESAGIKVIKCTPYNQFGALRYINPLMKILPKLFSYQFLVVAKIE